MGSVQGTPSIVELAAEFGVSHMTISRVVNDRPGVSPALAFQIRKRMREVGYTPRPARPGPRGRDVVHAAVTTGTIGFVHLGSPATTNLPANMIDLLLGAGHAAAAAGFDLLFADIDAAEAVPGWLREGRVDGLIICGYRRDDSLMALLGSFPTVWLSSHPNLARGDDEPGHSVRDRVLSGNHVAGRMAADYLAFRGHSRVAVVNPLGGWQLFQTRGDAFELAARRAGATVTRCEGPSRPDEAIFEIGRAELETRVAPLVDGLVAMPPAQRPTGIFLIDAPVALAFYRCAARVAGLAIGRDVDVVAFGGHPAFDGVAPMPATVIVPEAARGQRAVSQLVWRIRHPGDARGMEVSIDPALVPGEILWPPADASRLS